MAYNVKYTLSFKDTFDDTIKLDILQRDYSGAAITVKGSADPVILKLDSGSDDIFENIKPTSAEINFMVETAGTYDEFYEIDSKEYQVKIYKNAVCIWSGWINDEVFQEEYSPGYYEISLTATDGIAFLKTKRTLLTGRQTHFDIIKEALDEIGLALNIVDAVNIYEDSHDTDDGPLKQTSFDTDVFADGSERYYLADTLRDVLFTYGARITQHDNKWVIATIESYYAGLTGIEYSSAGVKIGAFTYNTQKTISIQSDASNICLLQGGTLQKNKGWRELKVKQVLGKTNKALILNGDFSSTTEYPDDKEKRTISNWFRDAAQTQNWNYYPATDEANVVEIRNHAETGDYLFVYDLLSMGSDPVILYSDLINAVEVEADVSKVYVYEMKFALLQIWGGTTITNKYKLGFKVEAINEGGTTYYLNHETQAWQTDTWTNIIEEIPYQNKDEFSFQKLTIKTVGFPGGKIRVTLYCYSMALDIVYYGTAVDEIKFFAEEVNNDIGYVYQSGINDENFTHVPSPIEFTENDIPIADPANIPIFYKNYLSLADGTPTLSWTSGEGYIGYLSSIYLQSILNQHSKSTRIKNFNAIGVIAPNMVLKDEQDILFMLTGYSYSLKENQCDIDCFEIIEPNTAAITITTVEYLDDPESGGGSDETNGGGTTGTAKDRLVSMVNSLGVETGPPGRLQDKLFHLEFFGNNPTYVPCGIGYGLRDAFNDYSEVLAGNFPISGTGTIDSWVDTDRLFSIGNGRDANNRSNALCVWKSGYAGFYNAICISAYDHGVGVEPIDGSLQYTALNRFEGYFNEKWNKLAYSTDIIDTFIGLTDTPEAYETDLGADVNGFSLIVAPYTGNNVIFNRTFGAERMNLDGDLPDHMWIKKCCPDVIDEADNVLNGNFTDDLSNWISVGWTHSSAAALHTVGNNSALSQSFIGLTPNSKKLTFTVSGMTAGSLTAMLDCSPESLTITANGTYTVNFSGTATPAVLSFLPTSDFDGALDSVSMISQVHGGYGLYQVVGKDYNGDPSGFTLGWNGSSVYIGRGAGIKSLGANGNVVFAPDGCGNILNGANNTILGYGAGSGIINSSGSILIGNGVNNASNTDNYLNIGNIIYGLSTDINLSGNLTLHKGLTPEMRFPTSYGDVGKTMVVTSEHQLGWRTFVDTFIGLTDTFDAYPPVDHGYVLTCDTNSVNYSTLMGSDASGAWFQTEASEVPGSDVGNFIKDSAFYEYGDGWSFNLANDCINFAGGTGVLKNIPGLEISIVAGQLYKFDFQLFPSSVTLGGGLHVYINNEYIGFAEYEDRNGVEYFTMYFTATSSSDNTVVKLVAGNRYDNFEIYKWEIIPTGYSASSGLRAVDTAFNTLYTFPPLAGAEGQIQILGENGVMYWGDLGELLTGKFTDLGDCPSTYGNIGTFVYQKTADTLGFSAYTLPTSLPSVDSIPVITSAGASSWMSTSVFSEAWLKGGQNIGAKKVLGSIDNYDIGFITNNVERVTLNKSGLLNPLFNVRLENTTHAAEVGIIYKGTAPFIHNFNYGNNGVVTTLGFNFFAGFAGNLTMGATATNASQASYNTMIGYLSGRDNTLGSYLSFDGYNSGLSNTTGSRNTYKGFGSGMGNIIGNDNTSVGFNSARYITGSSASLTNFSEGVFIGSATKAKEDNSTNEIVIGYNTTGNGSNTVTIGNTSITDNYLTGNLQIGNKFKILEGGATPTKYTILQGGDQTADITYTLPTTVAGGNGYVLSSTTAGVLSWVAGSSLCPWVADTNGIHYSAGNVGIGGDSVANYVLTTVGTTLIKTNTTSAANGLWVKGEAGNTGYPLYISMDSSRTTDLMYVEKSGSSNYFKLDQYCNVYGKSFIVSGDTTKKIDLYGDAYLRQGTFSGHVGAGSGLGVQRSYTLTAIADNARTSAAIHAVVGTYGTYGIYAYATTDSQYAIRADGIGTVFYISQNSPSTKAAQKIDSYTSDYGLTVYNAGTGGGINLSLTGTGKYLQCGTNVAYIEKSGNIVGTYFNGYTPPSADGTSGQALITNGSKVLSWGSFLTSLSGAWLLGSQSFGGSGYASLGSSTATTVGFITGGSERFRITATGKIGVRTTAPTLDFEINSPDGNNLRLIYNDADGSPTAYADLLTTSSGGLNIAPVGDFTLTQSSVVPFTSVALGAVADTLKLEAGIATVKELKIGTTDFTTITGVLNITPTSNFTLTQNSVIPFSSVSTSAVADTLKLDTGVAIVKQLKITTGATNGYYLKSDANGLASWAEVVTGSKWTADTYGINYASGNVGINGNSLTDYNFYVNGDSYFTSSAAHTIAAVNLDSVGTGIGIFGSSVNNYGVQGSSTNAYGGGFGGLGINIYAGGLYIGGSCAIDAAKNADFHALNIGGTTRISDTGVFTPSNGFSGTGNYTTFTVLNGIITAAS